MSVLTCSFCNRISPDMDGWKQLFVRSMTDPEDTDNLMLCPSCAEKYIKNNINAVEDPDVIIDNIKTGMEPADPEREYIGMTLRDFLSTDMYLTIQNIFFQDKLNTRIEQYLPVLDARILDIGKPDDHGVRMVTLDTVIDLSPEDSAQIVDDDTFETTDEN